MVMSNRQSEGKQQVVSVRFTEHLLRIIQAYAVVFDTSPNAVIREACEFFFREKVGTPEYQKAVDAHLKRAEEQVKILREAKLAEAI